MECYITRTKHPYNEWICLVVLGSVESVTPYRGKWEFIAHVYLALSFRISVGCTILYCMRYHHPAIVVLVKTRILGQRAITVHKTLGFDRAVRSNAIGFSGGIWLLWDSVQVHLDALSVSSQVIHAFVQVNVSNSLWLFSTIYASHTFDSRLELWDHLAEFSGTHSLPWVVT